MSNTSALAGRPDTYAKKTVGIVVTTVGEKRVKFTMVDSEKKFANGENIIKVNLEDVPLTLTEKDNGKQFRIRMNQDGDEVEALTPVSGLFRLRLIDLGPKKDKDADPEPVEKDDSRFGKEGQSHLEFFAVYKITQGRFKGVQCPAYNLHYKFENDGNGYARFAGNLENPKATRLQQLYSWGNVHDLYSEEIVWPKNGNILPTLLERGLDGGIEVDGLFKDGYIKEILPVQDEDDEVEETPKKRSVAEINKELGYEDEEGKPTKKASKEDDLDVDKDFPKDEPKKAKKVAKKVQTDDEEDDL